MCGFRVRALLPPTLCCLGVYLRVAHIKHQVCRALRWVLDYRALCPSPSDCAAGFRALLVLALVFSYVSRDESSPGKTVLC